MRRAITREAIMLADETGIAMLSAGARLADLSDHVGSRNALEGLADCDIAERFLVEAGMDTPDNAMRGQLDFLRGSILVRFGQVDQAIPLLRKALQNAEDRGDTQWRTLGRYGLVVGLIAQREIEEARVFANQAVEISTELGGSGEIVLAKRADGLVALAEGDAPRAIKALEAALTVMRAKTSLLAEEMILTALTDAYREVGEIGRARGCGSGSHRNRG